MSDSQATAIGEEIGEEIAREANAAASLALAAQGAELKGNEPNVLALGISAGMTATVQVLRRRGFFRP